MCVCVGAGGMMSARLDFRPVLAIRGAKERHPLHSLRVGWGHPEVQHDVPDPGLVAAGLVDRAHLQLNRRPAGSVVLQRLPGDHPGLPNAGGDSGGGKRPARGSVPIKLCIAHTHKRSCATTTKVAQGK